jgi:glucose/arabinose dehydrogenase
MLKNAVIGLLFGGMLTLLLASPLAAQDADATPDPGADVAYTVEKVMSANFPVAMAFTEDGRLFYTEKTTGNIRLVFPDGTDQIDPVIHLDTDALVERGLLGIALDPGYAENGTIWTVHTRPGDAQNWPANDLVRFHEADGVGSDPQVMLSVPITNGELQHNSGNIHFDKDGLLYLSIGDYGDAANAQKLDVPQGKIHRFEVTADGLKPAPGNPFPDSSIYVYGLRNTFDFTIDPVSGVLFGSENGFHCDDEINRLLPGKNYGWSEQYGTQCFGTNPVDVPDYVAPLLSYNPTIAPTGIMVYDGEAFPDWQGQVFFCAFNTGKITRAVLDETRTKVVSTAEVTLAKDQGCRTDIAVAPDGSIYFDDVSAIYRLIPDAG